MGRPFVSRAVRFGRWGGTGWWGLVGRAPSREHGEVLHLPLPHPYRVSACRWDREREGGDLDPTHALRVGVDVLCQLVALQEEARRGAPRCHRGALWLWLFSAE